MSGQRQKFRELFNSEAARLRERLRIHLVRRVAGLREIHEDLVAETLADLYEAGLATLRHSRIAGEPTSYGQLDSNSLGALAMTILARRVADVYRRRARHVELESAVDPGGWLAPSTSETLSAQLQRSQLLGIVLEHLETLDVRDRELLYLVGAHGSSRGLGLDDAQRKRLSRLRQRLMKELEQRLGHAAIELIGEFD